MFKLRISVLVLVGLLLASGLQSGWAAGDREAELLGVLKSDASFKEKSDACRQLGQVGTKDSIATLAGLLGDEKLSHMARIMRSNESRLSSGIRAPHGDAFNS